VFSCIVTHSEIKFLGQNINPYFLTLLYSFVCIVQMQVWFFWSLKQDICDVRDVLGKLYIIMANCYSRGLLRNVNEFIWLNIAFSLKLWSLVKASKQPAQIAFLTDFRSRWRTVKVFGNISWIWFCKCFAAYCWKVHLSLFFYAVSFLLSIARCCLNIYQLTVE